MAKKYEHQTLHIRLLNSDGEKKINELIGLGMIKIDEEYIEIMRQKEELTGKLSASNEQLEYYLRKKLLE